ncbi:copper resistance protein CopC [Corynebacterium sp. B5-R-101]|uniref:Copper resistance protein CopC n=2 Tax=Corynebacterium TaxID=1716 RepID=A0ABU9UG41_9CORY|nr:MULTISPECIES: copper resistance protein CopC [Corynebacterium]MCL8494671.1 copper resistance protein CopC [Corynebacterium intestinale]MCP1390907.1 copper resistance protein CopC [Corynebacterium intestinale]OFK92292.1 copper resistance protein [Corynebacterium sp. HMSC068H04]PKZ26220.1 copper resistance protein [Corynebacterium aurimucosum]
MQLRQVTTGIAAGAACLAVGLSAPLAAAHDSVIGGNVVSDAPLEEFPREITLEFSGIPKDNFNTFAVSDKTSGDVLFDATPTIDGRNLTVEVPQDVEPGDGDYQVGFRITSSDGHSTLGSVPFSVASGAGGDKTADASADGAKESDDAEGSQDPLSSLPTAAKWIIGVGAVLVVGAALFAFGAKTRRSGGEDPEG